LPVIPGEFYAHHKPSRITLPIGCQLEPYRRRWFLFGELATYGLAMIGYAFSSKVTSLVITGVPDAIANAILMVTVNASLPTWLVRKTEARFSATSAGSPLGAT
jgi:hypothetical protein